MQYSGLTARQVEVHSGGLDAGSRVLLGTKDLAFRINLGSAQLAPPQIPAPHFIDISSSFPGKHLIVLRH